MDNSSRVRHSWATALPESASESTLCFQRTRGRDVAAPVIYKDQIVLPLFDTSTYQSGTHKPGSTVDGKREEVKPNDRLGFFDTKTGKLLEVIELKHAFEGNRLALTDQVIMIGAKSDFSKSTFDSFMIFDRLKGNLVHGTNPRWRSLAEGPRRLSGMGTVLKPGMPYLSPTNPLVAIYTIKRVEIWKLDSEKDSFEVVQSFGLSGNRNNNSQSLAISWHPHSPTVAWLDDYRLVYWNADRNELVKSEYRAYRTIIPTEDGWLVVGSGRMEKRDLEMKIQKTWVTTNPRGSSSDMEQSVGAWDQCITADGKILMGETKSNLRAVQLRGNRIETITVDAFEDQGK